MGLWQRLLAAFGTKSPTPPRTSPPPPPPPDPPEATAEPAAQAPPAVQAKAVFAGQVARALEGQIRGLVREAGSPEDKQLIALLLRAVKNDGADLPAMPKELVRIQRLLSDPDVDVGELSKAVQRDPMIAAKFLALANSPFYTGRHKITDVRQAIVRLGLATTQMLITAILARSRVFKVARHEAEANALYQHALASASVAQMLARQVGEDEQEAFMAGLFHDLGRVFVLTAAGQVSARTKKGQPPSRQMLDRAQDLLDAGFSAMIVESWGYEDRIVRAIQRHHEPVPEAGEETLAFPEDDERLTYLVAAADQLGYGLDGDSAEAQSAARQLLDALDVELDDALWASAQSTMKTFLADLGAHRAA